MFRTHLFTAILMVPLVACSAGHDHPPVIGIVLPPSDLEPDSGAAGSPDLGAGGDEGTSTGGTPSMLKKPSKGSGGSSFGGGMGVGGDADAGSGGQPTLGAGGSPTAAGGMMATGGANPGSGGKSGTGGQGSGGQATGGSGSGGAALTGGAAGAAGGTPGAGGAVPADAGPPYGPSDRVGTYNVTTTCSFKPPSSWFSLPVVASSRPECVRCDETKLTPQQKGCVNWCAATGTFDTVMCSAAAAIWSDDGREFTQSFLCLDSATNTKITMSIDSIQSSLDGSSLAGTVYVENDSGTVCNAPFTAVR